MGRIKERRFMTWKEKFDKEFEGFHCTDKEGFLLQEDDFKSFIEKEVIEKLIESIPSDLIVESFYPREELINTNTIKSNLRKKWIE